MTRTKHELLWSTTRAKWVRLNPANHQGYYVCWMCRRWVSAEDMELDHVQSRSRHPELRYTLSNLRPSCHDCNESKGSTVVNPQPMSYPHDEELERLF